MIRIIAMAIVTTHRYWGSAGDWGHTWSGPAGTLGSGLNKDSLGPPHTTYKIEKPNQVHVNKSVIIQLKLELIILILILMNIINEKE